MSEENKEDVGKAVVGYIESLSAIAERHADRSAASLLAYTGLILILIGVVLRAMPLLEISAPELVTLFVLGFLSVLASALTRVWLYSEETKRADLVLDYERKAHEDRVSVAANHSSAAESAVEEARKNVG